MIMPQPNTVYSGGNVSSVPPLSAPDPSATPGTSEPMPGRIPLPPPFAPAVAVNRTHFKVLHLANYRYMEPARRVYTQLRLIPPAKRYYQTRLDYSVQLAPLPYDNPISEDAFGNVVMDACHEVIRENLSIAVEFEVETWCAYTDQGLPLPTALPQQPDEDPDFYREFTIRTTPSEAMKAFAEEIAGIAAPDREPIAFLVALCERVHREMTFDSKSTGVQTTAAEAWNNRRGVCQDYSHVVLAMCRHVGVPARYISGFVPGEGVMHAWVEALLPIPVRGENGTTDHRMCWLAYDTTYNHWVSDNYITVATGRGYSDITPTSGTYYGGGNSLTHRNWVKRLKRDVLLL
ncbi:MAG: transglutaminase family protein [Armatimonadaceae bacterium]